MVISIWIPDLRCAASGMTGAIDSIINFMTVPYISLLKRNKKRQGRWPLPLVDINKKCTYPWNFFLNPTRPTRPNPKSAIVAGSGTGAPGLLLYSNDHDT